jgi:hypothetical protein
VSRQCQQCSSSYFLLNGICYQLPDNCLQINSQRQCVSCANGFQLQGGICYRLIENCLSYSGGVCIQCRQGYYVSFGACISITAELCGCVPEWGMPEMFRRIFPPERHMLPLRQILQRLQHNNLHLPIMHLRVLPQLSVHMPTCATKLPID